MNQAFSVGLMFAMAVIFTSCTATVVQQWAIARRPNTEFVPPPGALPERRQAATPVKAGDPRKPDKPAEQQQPVAPQFEPVRGLPKN